MADVTNHEPMTCPFGSVVFGKDGMDKEAMLETFKDLRFSFIKQIHSDIIVPASSELHEADAHFCFEKNQALAIQTADCIPAIIMGPNVIAAVHAGWRGVASNIGGKMLQTLKADGVLPADLYVFIGPHIQAASAAKNSPSPGLFPPNRKGSAYTDNSSFSSPP